MRKGLLLVVFLLSVSGRAQGATPEPKATGSAAPATRPLTQREKKLADSAPADVYFGAQGMSPLSIRSTIGFLGRQYHYRTISDHDLLRKALITEDALRRWRTKYPNDPWLAPTFFHLEQLYQAVQSEEARKHATAILKDVVANYPDTKQGHLSRSRLAAGFPALVPETPLLVSPSPSAMPSAAPSPAESGGESPLPDMSASPGASTTPSPQPSATPSASSASPAPSASPG